jgi:hypothetical protein
MMQLKKKIVTDSGKIDAEFFFYKIDGTGWPDRQVFQNENHFNNYQDTNQNFCLSVNLELYITQCRERLKADSEYNTKERVASLNRCYDCLVYVASNRDKVPFREFARIIGQMSGFIKALIPPSGHKDHRMVFIQAGDILGFCSEHLKNLKK